jgi:hypothetical protein
MNNTITKSTAAMLAVASALTAAPVLAANLPVPAPLRQCGMMDNVPSATQLLDKADLGDRAVGQSDVGFFVNSTKTVNESEVSVTASFGPAGCVPLSTVVTAGVRQRQSEGPGILPAIATGVGTALGGGLQGALTKPSKFSFTGGDATATGGTATATAKQSQTQKQSQKSVNINNNKAIAEAKVKYPNFDHFNKEGKPCDKYNKPCNDKQSSLIENRPLFTVAKVNGKTFVAQVA